MTTPLLPSEAKLRRHRSEAAQQGAWTRRILAVWHATTEEERQQGEAWYDTAYMTLAAIDPQNPERVVGAAAAISPLQQWDTNVRQTRRLIYALDNKLPVPQVHTEPMQSQAVRIALGENLWDVLKGQKIRAFAASILGADNQPVVDRWAIRVALGKDMKSAPKGRTYERLALAYIRAAERAGVSPRTMQATTWVHIRNISKGS